MELAQHKGFTKKSVKKDSDVHRVMEIQKISRQVEMSQQQ